METREELNRKVSESSVEFCHPFFSCCTQACLILERAKQLAVSRGACETRSDVVTELRKECEALRSQVKKVKHHTPVANILLLVLTLAETGVFKTPSSAHCWIT